MRTYSRADWVAAQQEWDDGEFGYRWRKYREIAAERGFIFPPHGTPHDDIEVDNPSQRAIVWREIEDNPTELERIMLRSRSWSEVVDGIFGLRKRLALEADEADQIDRWERQHDPDHRESASALKNILTRISDS